MARMKSQEEDEEEEDKEEQVTFRQFAVANFRGNVNYQFSKRPLRQSLLDIPLPSDQVVSMLFSYPLKDKKQLKYFLLFIAIILL